MSRSGLRRPPPGRARRLVSSVTRPAVAGMALVTLLAGCGGPILANPAAARDRAPAATPTRSAAVDPQPISLPADDSPHNRLTEWWYYTGHLADASGHRYGFEYVVFRAERGSFPVSWASHLAITDERGASFHYAQRSEIGPQVEVGAAGAAGAGFDFRLLQPAVAAPGGPASPPAGTISPAVGGAEAPGSAAGAGPAWTMHGAGGHDHLAATASPAEAAAAGSPGGLGLDLTVVATKPAALHDGDGWIDFGPAGGSYYYSRTAMTATGSLVVGGRSVAVSGTAWFDHQWGDFVSVGGGGWDWFAVNLSDGTDLTLSLVRATDGSYPLVYGTIVGADGRASHLDRSAFSVTSTGTWRSPRTGAVYPSGWLVEVPGERLRIELHPSVADQELDTRPTTGVVYWEGSQVVAANRAGTPLGGQAYVELTGYGP